MGVGPPCPTAGGGGEPLRSMRRPEEEGPRQEEAFGLAAGATASSSSLVRLRRGSGTLVGWESATALIRALTQGRAAAEVAWHTSWQMRAQCPHHSPSEKAMQGVGRIGR